MGTIAFQIVMAISLFLRILSIALWVYVIMSWFVRPYNRVYIFVRNLVAPLLAPFRPVARKLMEAGVMVDLSVVMAWIVLRILQSVLPRLVYALFGL